MSKSFFFTFTLFFICLYSYGNNPYTVVEAKGDGVHDDTEAIQMVIDSLSKAGGGVAFLECGTFLVSSIRLGVKTSIIGSGNGATIIKQKENCNENCLVVSRNSAALKISDLTLLGTNQNCGLFFDDSSSDGGNHSYLYGQNTSKSQPYKWITIDNVCIYHFATGMQLERWAWDVNICNSTISHNGNGVILKCTDSSLYNCYIMNNSKSGLLLYGSNNKISNLKSIWNGISDAKNAGAILILGARNQLVNCETQDNYCSGVIVNGEYNQISNCVSNTDGYCNSLKQYDPFIEACGFKIKGLYNIFSNCAVTSYTEKYGAVFHSPVMVDESVSYHYPSIFKDIRVMIDKDRLFFREPFKNVQSLNTKNSIANVCIEGENGKQYFVSKQKKCNVLKDISCQTNSLQLLIDFKCLGETGQILSLGDKRGIMLDVINKCLRLRIGNEIVDELRLDDDAILDLDDMRLIVSFNHYRGKGYLSMLCYEKTIKRGWIKKEVRREIAIPPKNMQDVDLVLGDVNVFVKRMACTNVPLTESVFLPYSNINEIYASSYIYVDADSVI